MAWHHENGLFEYDSLAFADVFHVNERFSFLLKLYEGNEIECGALSDYDQIDEPHFCLTKKV